MTSPEPESLVRQGQLKHAPPAASEYDGLASEAGMALRSISNEGV